MVQDVQAAGVVAADSHSVAPEYDLLSPFRTSCLRRQRSTIIGYLICKVTRIAEATPAP